MKIEDKVFYDRNSKEGEILWEKFRSVVKGNNFMTPVLLGFYKVKNHIVEVTTDDGKAPWGRQYGLTVVSNNKNNFDLSTSVWSQEEIDMFINNLT